MFDREEVGPVGPAPDWEPDPAWLVENLPVDDTGQPYFPADDGPHLIPPDLDACPPGPRLAAMLSTIDVARLSGHDQVTVLRAFRRLASHFEARMYGAMVGITDSYRLELGEDAAEEEWVQEAASAEIRAALRLTRRSASSELGVAHVLCQRLPQVAEALAAGRIDRRRAWLIGHETLHLPEDTARQVAGQVLERAEGWTTSQLTRQLRRLAIGCDPNQATDRYEETVRERRVVAELTDDGTARLLGLDLPPDRVAQIRDRIEQIARSLNTGSETRTMDQLRADVFMDLLAGRHHRGRSGSVHVTVDAATLAGLAEHPGELAGMGPVIADIARQVAHRARSWIWTVTHPDTGLPLESGVTRRRPDHATRRAVWALHPVCIFPGCLTPAHQCDLDHRIPFSEGGPTSGHNLAPACRPDHHIRHRAGWHYRRLANGDHLWKSPLGHHYTTSGLPP